MRGARNIVTILWTIGLFATVNAQTATNKIDSTGNVGIGILNPSTALSIYKTGAYDTQMGLTGQDHILFSAPSPGLGNYMGGITWRTGLRRRASIAAVQEHTDSDFIGIAFFTQGTDGPGPFYESMRLSRSGNLGIGTTNPEKGLHVMNNAIIRSTSQGGWDDGLVIYNENNGWAGTILHRNGTQGSSSAKYWYGLRNGTDNFIMMGPTISNSGSSLTAPRSDAAFEIKGEEAGDPMQFYIPVHFGQNVGIGTTTPDQKLTVAGTVKSQEVIVEATAGADFVFEEDYDLPTLAQIEKFIKANKHLEGIPSAKEMVDNGVKVGELQIKLLQKIEELTLHVIEQDKRDRKKDELIKDLLKRIEQLEHKKE